MKNAHEFPGLYDDLFDFTKAGYVMIDLENPFISFPVQLSKYQYVSSDPSLYWMKGLLTSWHVTARGPLDPRVRQSHCKQVLETVNLPKSLMLGAIEVFPSPYEDQNYECVVALIDDPSLFNLNQQLSVLPGVQTYIPYKPHMTLGYFEQGHTEEVVTELKMNLRGAVSIQGFDFGRMQE